MSRGEEGTAIWAIKGLDGGPTIHRPPVHSAAGTKEEILQRRKGKRERERERDINSILESINNVPGENRKWTETMEGQGREERRRDR